MRASFSLLFTRTNNFTKQVACLMLVTGFGVLLLSPSLVWAQAAGEESAITQQQLNTSVPSLSQNQLPTLQPCTVDKPLAIRIQAERVEPAANGSASRVPLTIRNTSGGVVTNYNLYAGVVAQDASVTSSTSAQTLNYLPNAPVVWHTIATNITMAAGEQRTRYVYIPSSHFANGSHVVHFYASQRSASLARQAALASDSDASFSLDSVSDSLLRGIVLDQSTLTINDTPVSVGASYQMNFRRALETPRMTAAITLDAGSGVNTGTFTWELFAGSAPHPAALVDSATTSINMESTEESQRVPFETTALTEDVQLLLGTLTRADGTQVLLPVMLEVPGAVATRVYPYLDQAFIAPAVGLTACGRAYYDTEKFGVPRQDMLAALQVQEQNQATSSMVTDRATRFTFDPQQAPTFSIASDVSASADTFMLINRLVSGTSTLDVFELSYDCNQLADTSCGNTAASIGASGATASSDIKRWSGWLPLMLAVIALMSVLVYLLLREDTYLRSKTPPAQQHNRQVKKPAVAKQTALSQKQLLLKRPTLKTSHLLNRPSRKK